MQDLIDQYYQGRRLLRDKERQLKKLIRESDDPADLMDYKHDKSLINGMIRDMTDAIGVMKNSQYKIRGSASEKNEILMDPHVMSSIHFQEEKHFDPENEDQVKEKIMDIYGQKIRERMHLLTNKQQSTLHRWIYEEMSMSEIALEDAVSRQAIYQRIFGNKSHSGAIIKLREG